MVSKPIFSEAIMRNKDFSFQNDYFPRQGNMALKSSVWDWALNIYLTKNCEALAQRLSLRLLK